MDNSTADNMTTRSYLQIIFAAIMHYIRGRRLVRVSAGLITLAILGCSLLVHHNSMLRKQAEQREWDAKTVSCLKCSCRFIPQDHKAPFWGAVSAGTAGGAAAGAAGGGWAGAGTGVAVGGAGAFPGYIIGAVGGGIGGGILGGISTAWYRDRQVKCPNCGNVFRNPKN